MEPKNRPRWDFTADHWFSHRKINQHSNLLLDIVPNFDYLATYGKNTLEGIATYIGEHNYMDKLTGYVIHWDGRHTCDRCGAIKELSGATKNVRLAWALKENPWMKRVGLCANCERDMANEDKEYIRDDRFLNDTDKPMPNDWVEYAWL